MQCNYHMNAKKGTTSARPGRAETIKRLRAFAKVPIGDAPGNLADTIENETDRGCVILLSTAIEDVLKSRILENMVEINADETERLFGPDAPLGSFSAKIKIGRALGIIDRDIARMCDVLRDMRNACAHSGRGISFDDKVLRDALAVLMAFTTDEELDYDNAVGVPYLLRLYLTWSIGWLIKVIRHGSRDKASKQINLLIADTLQEVKNFAKENATTSPEKRPE